MRFIHQNVGDLCAYVAANRAFPGEPISIGSIEEMRIRSDTLWGMALPYYLVACHEGASIAPLPLSRAVEDVERSDLSDMVLFIAYQDGGVISISGRLLPFQRQKKSADWWRPN